MARLSVNTVAVLAWLFLVCASLATYTLFEGHTLSVTWAVATVMVISAIKARTIILHYMELKHAPLGWRVAFELWVVIVASMILGVWLFAGAPDCPPT